MKKIMIAALLIVAILVGGTGCMFDSFISTENKPSVNNQAISYMEEKYGESFEMVAPYGDSMTGIRKILVSCDSLPGQQILVQVDNFREENKIFRDNYLAVKYREESIAFWKKCIAPACPDVNVFYEVAKSGLSSELGADASFEEFLADDRVEMIVMMELKAGSSAGKEAIEDAVANIAASCKNMTLTIIVVDDDVFGTLDRAGLNDRISMGEYVIQATVYIDGDQVKWTWRGEV